MQSSTIPSRRASPLPGPFQVRVALSSALMRFGLVVSLLVWRAVGEVFVGTFPYVPEGQPPNPDHVLEINLPQNGDLRLTVTTSATLGFNNGTMGFYDRDRATRIKLFSPGLGTTEVFTVQALRVGTYYLIFHPSSLSYGDYLIEATALPNPFLNDQEPNDSLEQARPVTLGGRNFGHLGYAWQLVPYDRYDYWKFVLPEDSELDNLFEVAFNFLSGAVLCEDGSLGMTGGLVEAGAKDLLKFQPPHLVAGTYFLKLEQGYPGVSFGGYAFTLTARPAPFANDPANNDTPLSAVPVELRSPVEGHLGYVGGSKGITQNDLTDWWSFQQVTTGDLQVECQTTARLPFVVDIYRQDNEQRVFGGTLDDGQAGTLVVKNLPAGSYRLNVRCYRWNWGSYSFRLIPVTQSNVWTRWLEQHFSPAEMAAGQLVAPTADPDGDQQLNLMEFALGHNPRERDAERSSALVLSRIADPAGNSRQAVSFERPADRLTALRYLVQYSNTLNPPHWQALLASETVTPLTDRRESVRLVDPDAFGAQPSRFYRLGVELKP